MAEPLRVVYVNHVSRCGGAELSLLSLLRRVREQGVEPHALAPEGDLAERLRALGIPVTLLPAGRLRRTAHPLSLLAQFRWTRRLRREAAALCREVGADLVHANSLAAAVALAQGGAPLPPLVWHCRDLLAPPAAIRWLAPRCAAILAISHAVERHILEAAPAHARTAVIYNGLDPADLRLAREPAEVRREFGLAPEAPLLVSVGQLTPWKRHELSLRAAERMRAAHPDLRWLIVGEAFPEDAAYARRLREAAPANVIFTGYRPDVADLVRAADIFVHPATAEAFGRAVLEAMALGTPGVAARAGGIPELLEHETERLAGRAGGRWRAGGGRGAAAGGPGVARAAGRGRAGAGAGELQRRAHRAPDGGAVRAFAAYPVGGCAAATPSRAVADNRAGRGQGNKMERGNGLRAAGLESLPSPDFSLPLPEREGCRWSASGGVGNTRNRRGR